MALNYEVDLRGFVVIIAVGENTIDDYVDAFRRIGRDDRCKGLTRYVFDTTGIKLTLDATQIGQLGSFMGQRGAEDRRIAVVVNSRIHFGTTRMFQAYSEDRSLEIFEDKEEAIKWLTEGEA